MSFFLSSVLRLFLFSLLFCFSFPFSLVLFSSPFLVFCSPFSLFIFCNFSSALFFGCPLFPVCSLFFSSISFCSVFFSLFFIFCSSFLPCYLLSFLLRYVFRLFFFSLLFSTFLFHFLFFSFLLSFVCSVLPFSLVSVLPFFPLPLASLYFGVICFIPPFKIIVPLSQWFPNSKRVLLFFHTEFFSMAVELVIFLHPKIGIIYFTLP